MTNSEEEISLRELCVVAWRGRMVIVATTLAFAAAAIVYSFLAEKWYRAEVVLAPAEDQSALPFGAQIGGIAALAGLGIGGGNVVEAVATLKSKQLARVFIEDLSLVTVFFADDWDKERGRWLDDDPDDWPDVRDAVKYFQDSVLSVSEDRQTGLVTLSVEWTDPEIAADWANQLASRVNLTLRERALRNSTANVAYLQAELAKTDLVEMRETAGQLLEAELQKLMLAKGDEEFAFRIIDAAAVPKEPVWPRRAVLAVVGTLLGGIVGFLVAFVPHTRNRWSRDGSTAGEPAEGA